MSNALHPNVVALTQPKQFQSNFTYTNYLPYALADSEMAASDVGSWP